METDCDRPVPDWERRFAHDGVLTCVVCGATIDGEEWHPVRARTDAGGSFHVDVFCSMACRAEHVPQE